MKIFIPRPAVLHTLSFFVSLTLVLSPVPASAQATLDDDRRFIQIFIEDAAIVENAWVEGQVRRRDLQGNNDTFEGGPVLAFSPVDRLEVGGRVNLIDADFGPRSKNGVGDTTVWGKWQIVHNPIQFTVGAELFLPTGDEDDNLGTGEVDAALFAAVRKNLAHAAATGFLGVRSNSDTSVGGNLGPSFLRDRDGKPSVFLGGGILVPASRHFGLSGELTVETERFEKGDSSVEATAGGYWFIAEHVTLRAGLGIGLDDGAPDWEGIFGLAWHF
ncbi:MAG: hypothetical protein ACE5HD_02925 [Acidobacteriota bacterium]